MGDYVELAGVLRPHADPPIGGEGTHAPVLLTRTVRSHIKTMLDMMKAYTLGEAGLVDLCGVFLNLRELLELTNTLKDLQSRDDRPVVYLRLNNNGLRDDGRSMIANWLKSDRWMRRLELAGNFLRKSSLKHIARALTENRLSQLQHLDLSSNRCFADGMLHVAPLLAKNHPPLLSLNIANNIIEDDGALLVLEALNTNTTLTSLDLTNNGLREGSATKLAETLTRNSTLKHLFAGKNRLMTSAAWELCPVLKDVNVTLQTLWLPSTVIAYEAGPQLKDMVESNTSLTVLNLDGCPLAPRGCYPLFEGMAKNASIRELYIGETAAIIDKQADAIRAMVANNTTLEFLDMHDCRFSLGSLEAFFEGLASNPASKLRVMNVGSGVANTTKSMLDHLVMREGPCLLDYQPSRLSGLMGDNDSKRLEDINQRNLRKARAAGNVKYIEPDYRLPVHATPPSAPAPPPAPEQEVTDTFQKMRDDLEATLRSRSKKPKGDVAREKAQIARERAAAAKGPPKTEQPPPPSKPATETETATAPGTAPPPVSSSLSGAGSGSGAGVERRGPELLAGVPDMRVGVHSDLDRMMMAGGLNAAGPPTASRRELKDEDDEESSSTLESPLPPTK